MKEPATTPRFTSIPEGTPENPRLQVGLSHAHILTLVLSPFSPSHACLKAFSRPSRSQCCTEQFVSVLAMFQ